MSTNGSTAAYGLLDDVELPIEVRLGEVELTLEQILRLGPGGMVPLGPVSEEPVELAVAGLTYARGELVIVDGSFALRVRSVTGHETREGAVPALDGPSPVPGNEAQGTEASGAGGEDEAGSPAQTDVPPDEADPTEPVDPAKPAEPAKPDKD